MLMPSLFGESLFDEWDPFREMDREMRGMERRLYGHNAKREMRTDVKEKEDGYELDMDLPGFGKDQITLSLENGCLTVTAEKGMDKEEKDKAGRLLRQERYAGTMQRSFYVGENITENDVKASFENGVLHLELPKVENRLPEKRLIRIEG